MKPFKLNHLLAIALCILSQQFAVAQDTKPEEKTISLYQATVNRTHDLVHTRLEASFDYSTSTMPGKVWLTIQPHFYAADKVVLDAKGMTIHNVSIMQGNKQVPLKYEYNGESLTVMLNRSYKGGEKFIININYLARPNEYKAKGSSAITDAKGLYFINPKGEDKAKAIQIWTQGETEATSVWCPTIDKPNQKSTQEFYLTVPAKYVSLSNGKLVSQKVNADGTRTDYWKMDQPHAPYLFFMGIGDYAVIKDTWRGKEVNYYVEKEYASVARKIFGLTPEMMTFFSRITGVDYPWNKYAQMTAQDYVSGAMENTTATLHGSSSQQDARELVDGNNWEGTIAHELFHQWFGDYVTAESWSNLTLNESFANYSEYLWDEYKYGKDEADHTHWQAMNSYLQSESEIKDLVRFDYADKEDMFDAVSYQKGGRILHMLRNVVGDSAFFKSLNHYLTTNKYKAAEAHQLRLSFEEVTGKDLNWFFNQWYFGSGHPKLDITYDYLIDSKQTRVIVKQTQTGEKIFTLPVAIDVYNGSKKTRHEVWVENRIDTFLLASTQKPDLVNFDGEKYLLCTKKENKTAEEYAFQFRNASKYMDRREAIEFFAKKQNEGLAQDILKEGLKDPSDRIRMLTISRLDMKNEKTRSTMESPLVQMAGKDPKTTVRGAAIGALGNYTKAEYVPLFRKGLSDSSYAVASASLNALAKTDKDVAIAEADKLLKTKPKGQLGAAVMNTLAASGKEEYFNTFHDNYSAMGLSDEKFGQTMPYAEYLAKLNNTQMVKTGVDDIVKFRESIPEAYRGQTDPYINQFVLKGIADKKKKQLEGAPNTSGLQEQIDYILSKVSK